ncbi:SGNH/GDSL hydrolase family protein, partial [Agrobacterium tumefaciens]|uniref:SGNH/GDSL hydrolase family protein n=1 Tax=Agrobacterium tumefaciens TaxID=358 RepID=UPI001B8A40DB
YAAAAGISTVFSTKAEADAGLSSVAANAFVKVLVDESQADVETIYQKVSGSYVLKAKAGQKEVRLENFGAMLDGSSDDSAAVLSAISWVSANGGRIIGTGGRTCYCASLIDLTGVDFFSERDFKFRGNIDLSKENSTLLADLNVDIDSAGVKYPYKMPRGFKKPFAEKGLWLGAGDLIRDKYTRVDPGTLNKVKVAHPGGDTFAADALPIAADQTISWNLTAGGEWHCGLQPAIGGRELSAVFSAGDYARAAFFVWSGGWIAIGAGQSSIGATVYKKDIGVAITSSNINWRGTANHPQWLAVNSEWTVRLYDERTAAVLMNGTEVYRFSLPTGAIITEYGFGVLASGPAINAGISRWTERRASVFGGQNQTSISVFGDSKSSPFYGVWLDACREALDATYGIRCINVVNNAVAGTNSLSVLQKMQTVGLGTTNYVVIYCGVNDIQGGSPLSASLQNMSDMLDIVINAGRVPVVVIPSLWLNSNQTSDGFATANAEKGAELRAAYRTLAASRGALIVDAQQLTGQILSDFITSPDLSDARVRDRIHDTPFVYRLVGQMIARVIAGDIVREPSPHIGAIPMPVRYFANGWYSTLRAPYVTVDKARIVQMEGILEAGTKSDGTTIIAFPINLRPARSKSFVAFSIRSSDGRRSGVLLEITSGGDLKIYGMPSDDNYIYLDPIKYEAS